ncbi:MAG: YkgJ family cysteine cluster protein [Usitatibacteraceae bacterium]
MDNLQKIHFFRERIPSFECVPGCHDCCGPVTASSEEMFELPVLDDAVHAAALAALDCVHLGREGCTVYADRPLICRLFGTTPRMVCPRGRGPRSMIDAQLDGQIHKFMAGTRQVLL